MGGSGGGYFSGGDPAKVRQQLQAASDQTTGAEYSAACNDYLTSLLARFNGRNVEATHRHLEEITKALEKELEGSIELSFGGSLAKHTYVDGLSDVDALVMLDNCELADTTPDVAREYLAAQLRERFMSAAVDKGTLGVTVSFDDIEIQLLPAVSCKHAVKISDSTGKQWSEISPQDFTRVLSRQNEAAGKKLVPTVKLAKAIIAELPQQQQISGYHAESLAIEVFKGFAGPFTHRDMLRHYFSEGAKRLLTPIADRTGQSVHVDDALGAPESLERKIVSDAFARIARRMANADTASRAEDWKMFFGDT